MIQTSIIILTHNNWGLVSACIQAVIRHTNNYELLFVVDSTVAFTQELKKFGHIIETNEPFNFASRINLAIKHASGEYIVLLNDDTEPQTGWLTHMITADRIRGPGIVSARCQPGGCSNRQAHGPGEHTYSRSTINMFATLISRRVLTILGPLDTRFIYYGGEDDDYSLRALRHRFNLIISAGYVLHRVGGAFTQDKVQDLLPKTRELFRTKWGVNLPYTPSGEHWYDETRFPFTQPLISILMPTRNHTAYIQEAVQSVLNQTYQNFELLIGIDGLDQPALNPILSIFNDPRIKLITSETPIGSCAMRNKLFKASEGEFIALMDSDDIMLPQRLSSQLTAMAPEIDIIHSPCILEGPEGTKTPLQTFPINKYMLLSEYSYVAAGTFFLRRWVLENALFNQEFHHAADFEFILKNYNRFSFYHLNEPTIIYRRHADAHESGNPHACAQHRQLIERYT